MKRDIARLVALDNDQWHTVSMKAAWHFRTATHLMPPIVLAVCGGVEINAEEWTEMRKAVNAQRKSDKSKTARYVRKQREEKKRTYQREYMRDWRAKRNQPTVP